MIELLIAALIQFGTLTSATTETVAVSQEPAPISVSGTTTSTEGTDGGTGAWDDGN